ncbi:transposase-like protein [Nitrobacter sp. TKz-YC01]
MWKPEHRLTAERRNLRYPSDSSDAEWVLVAPMIPPARRGGRRRSVDVREVLTAIFYVLSTGCQWKAMPKDLPPKSTAHFMGLGRNVGSYSRRTLYSGKRSNRTRGESHGCNHRLPN